MASSSSSSSVANYLNIAALISLTVILLISPAHSLTCTSQSFTNKKLYSQCADLPTLSSYLHWSYDTANSTLAVVFVAPPAKPAGWIAWAINPTGTGMEGAQTLVAYKTASGAMAVKTFNISGYTGDSIVPGKLDFEVWDTAAEASGDVFRLFAKMKVKTGQVNHVWQVGPSVSNAGFPAKHAFEEGNLQAKGTLTVTGTNAGVGATTGADPKMKNRNIHGILNAVSWGFLFPLGIIIARYMRVFPSANPAWFYLHVSCQLSVYAIGVAGWATGLKLGRGEYMNHRNIGITLFAFATVQMFALFLRPAKGHKGISNNRFKTHTQNPYPIFGISNNKNPYPNMGLDFRGDPIRGGIGEPVLLLFVGPSCCASHVMLPASPTKTRERASAVTDARMATKSWSVACRHARLRGSARENATRARPTCGCSTVTTPTVQIRWLFPINGPDQIKGKKKLIY